MAKDDDADEWGSTIDGKEAPAVGVNTEMLRAAIKLNPAMKKPGQSTTDILAEVSAAQAARQVGQPAEAQAKQKPRDFLAFLTDTKAKVLAEKKRLAEEKAKLDAEEKALGPKTLERVIDVLIELDPNMTSPQTLEILKMEAGFLNGIGFSTRKVIDRKMTKK